MRDYRQGKDTTRDATAPPPQTFSDDEPLPTFLAGMELAETAPTVLPLWYRRTLRDQGLLTPDQMERWSYAVRRGIEAV